LGEISGYFADNQSAIITNSKIFHSSIPNKNICRTKEQAEGLLALSMLSQLHYEFTEGEDKPDISAFIITKTIGKTNDFEVFCTHYNFFLRFTAREKAELFLESHVELIKQASV